MAKQNNKIDFTKLQQELDQINDWFQSQDTPDPSVALDKYRRSVEIIKEMKSYLAEVKNEFKVISKELEDAEN